MSNKNTYTRRSALALLGSGAALAVSETAGVRSTENILRRQGTLSVGGSNADISITDRKGNAPGAGNFGNYDPRASGGNSGGKSKTYLSVGNGLADDATTVAASNTNASVSYDGADSEIGADSTEDITLSHGQSSDQTTDLSFATGSQQLALDDQINVPVAPGSATSRWTLNDAETSSGTSTDAWGSNDLSVDSGVTTGQASSTGTYYTGESYEFTKNNTAGASGTVSGWGGDQTHSIALWMYATDTQGTRPILIGNYGTDHELSQIYFPGSNEILYGFWKTDVKFSATYLDQWVHLVATYSGGGGTTSSMSLYLNGTEQSVSKDNSDGAQLNLPSDPAVNVGQVDSNVAMSGRLSDVRLYNKALSSSEVSNLYQTGHING